MPVMEEEIDQMFEFADKDKDGKISYRLRMSIRKSIFILDFPVSFRQ